MMAAITAAAITGLVGLVLTKMWNVNFNALNTATDRNQAMQYVLNSADVVRATRYVNLTGSARAGISGTEFQREIIVTQDPVLTDTKQAVIRVYKGDSDISIASMIVKKSRVTLTLSQIPSHSHSFSWPRGDCGWSNGSGNTWWGNSFNASSNTSSAGGGGAHENRPPYYALYYIMKL